MDMSEVILNSFKKIYSKNVCSTRDQSVQIIYWHSVNSVFRGGGNTHRLVLTP
jgi:hypothetical protein